MVHNRIEDSAIEAVDLLIDFAAPDPESLGVGDELVRELVHRNDVRLRGLGHIAAYPLIQEVDPRVLIQAQVQVTLWVPAWLLVLLSRNSLSRAVFASRALRSAARTLRASRSALSIFSLSTLRLF